MRHQFRSGRLPIAQVSVSALRDSIGWMGLAKVKKDKKDTGHRPTEAAKNREFSVPFNNAR